MCLGFYTNDSELCPQGAARSRKFDRKCGSDREAVEKHCFSTVSVAGEKSIRLYNAALFKRCKLMAVNDFRKWPRWIRDSIPAVVNHQKPSIFASAEIGKSNIFAIIAEII